MPAITACTVVGIKRATNCYIMVRYFTKFVFIGKLYLQVQICHLLNTVPPSDLLLDIILALVQDTTDEYLSNNSSLKFFIREENPLKPRGIMLQILITLTFQSPSPFIAEPLKPKGGRRESLASDFKKMRIKNERN